MLSSDIHHGMDADPWRQRNEYRNWQWEDYSTTSMHEYGSLGFGKLTYSPKPAARLGHLNTVTPVTPSGDSTPLTDDDRRRMCPGVKQTDIGAMFGVERSTVSKVLRQKEKFLYSDDGSQSPAKKATGKWASADRPNKQTKGGPLNNSMIGKASKKFSNPKRAPRSVRNLSGAQLERKRALDRDAQRAIRERRRKLEQQVPGLIEGNKELERQVTELTEEKEQLEAQIAALQGQVTHMLLLLQVSHNLQYQPRLLEGYSVGPLTSGNPIFTSGYDFYDRFIELWNGNCHPLTSNVKSEPFSSYTSVLTPPSQTHPLVTYCQAQHRNTSYDCSESC